MPGQYWPMDAGLLHKEQTQFWSVRQSCFKRLNIGDLLRQKTHGPVLASGRHLDY